VESPSTKVLVVDDDPSIRFLCRVNLELEGWTVDEAGTIAEARERLASGPVTVVLLDVHVGSESGFALLEEIRRDHPGLPVAMLTGSSGTATPQTIVADSMIAKPFTLAELIETVRRLAATRKIE